MTDEQVAEAWAFRDRMSRLLLEAVELLAESHPEALRKALARAFDCPAIENAQDQMVHVLTRTQELANEQKLRLDERDRQIEANERRIDTIDVRLDKAAKAVSDLARLLDQLKRTGYVGPINRNGAKR